jgi:hypothetical protein
VRTGLITEDIAQWRVLVNTVMNLRFHKMLGIAVSLPTVGSARTRQLLCSAIQSEHTVPMYRYNV